jgi:hypothetical protein
MERLAQDPILANSEVRSTVLTGSRLLRDALPEGSFEQRERAALALANEMVREVVKAELVDLVAELEADAVEVDGRRYEKHQPGSVVYHSLCGPALSRSRACRSI